MSENINYSTVLGEGIASFEEKKSTFTGSISRVNSEEEAKEYIKKVRERNKEARHNVFGYVIGDRMQIQRYSDDGEPQGTGGMPVLEVIRKNNLKDCVIVVTRYFGGILLGTGGLTRAYTKAATMALQQTKIIERVKASTVDVEISYDLLGKVQYFLGQKKVHIEEIKYKDKVTISFYEETDKVSSLTTSIIDLTSNNCFVNLQDEMYYLKYDDRLHND